MFVADCPLPASTGRPVNLAQIECAVVFFYPYTGTPGVADPPGWDDIVGAHGSTPQALAYDALYQQFKSLDYAVYGVSLQAHMAQCAFVKRNNLSIVLLSDEQGQVTNSLRIPRFVAGDEEYLERTSVVLHKASVIYRRDKVMDPAQDSAQMLAQLYKLLH